jgi:hypothetical protein
MLSDVASAACILFGCCRHFFLVGYTPHTMWDCVRLWSAYVPRWLQGEDDFEVPRLPTRGGDRETDARDRLASRDRKRSEGSLVGGGTAADDRDSRAYRHPLLQSPWVLFEPFEDSKACLRLSYPLSWPLSHGACKMSPAW